MKTSAILLILSFIMILKGMSEQINEKYITSGCIIGLIGWFVYLISDHKDKNKRQDDGGKSYRNSKTWEDSK